MAHELTNRFNDLMSNGDDFFSNFGRSFFSNFDGSLKEMKSDIKETDKDYTLVSMFPALTRRIWRLTIRTVFWQFRPNATPLAMKATAKAILSQANAAMAGLPVSTILKTLIATASRPSAKTACWPSFCRRLKKKFLRQATFRLTNR